MWLLGCVGSSHRCSSASASGGNRRIKPIILILWWCGGIKGSVEERQKEPTQTLRKHAKYRQRRRALANWLRGDSRAPSPTSFPTFQKYLLSPVRANTVRMRRGCVWIPAYIDLCRSFLLRDDSCFSSNPWSHFLGCLGRKQRAAAANEIIADAAAVLWISRFKEQQKNSTEGFFKAGWRYSAFLQTDLNSLSVTQLLSCVSSFQMFSMSSLPGGYAR